MKNLNLILTISIALLSGQIKLYASDGLIEDFQKLTLAQPYTILQNNIKTTMAGLSAHRPFAEFNLQLSDDEVNVFNNLNISIKNEYISYGIGRNFETELMEFIKKIGSFYDDGGIMREYKTSLNENTAHKSIQIIKRLIQDVLHGSEQETALVKVRSFIPTKAFDLPRWHVDKSEHGASHRFVIALKGPGTWFYDVPTEQKEEYLAVRDERITPEVKREKLAKLLSDTKRISKPHPNQGAVFIINTQDGAVHSEPPIHETRFLLAVTPNSKAAILAMLEKHRLEKEANDIDVSDSNSVQINLSDE